MNVVDLADIIFQELGEPIDVSIASIAFWLVGNVGRLNILANLSYIIVDEEIVPTLEDQESAILKLIYENYYITSAINTNLSAASSTHSVIEVIEGDRRARVVNRNELAKSYLTMRRSLKDRLYNLIQSYKKNRIEPLGIDYVDICSYYSTYCQSSFSSSPLPSSDSSTSGDASFIVLSETPTGSINSINTMFFTDSTFRGSYISVFLNGVRVNPSFYSLVAPNKVVLQDAPMTGDEILVDYIKN